MINQTVETSFRVLLFLAGQEGKQLVSLQDIHEVVGGSATYLAKVTAVLSRAGLLKSQRGATGGLQLGKEAKKITMLEVVEAAQGGSFQPFELQRCTTGKGKWCNYHRASSNLNELVTNAMRKLTLAELLVTESKPTAGCVLKGVPKKSKK